MKHYRVYVNPGFPGRFVARGTDGGIYTLPIGTNGWRYRELRDPGSREGWTRLPVMTGVLAHGMLTSYANGASDPDIAGEEVEYAPGPNSRGLPPTWSNHPELLDAIKGLDRNS